MKNRESFRSSLTGQAEFISQQDDKNIRRALADAKSRMGIHYTKNQILGRKGAIGCVSLEISQRCNLNCSLCYLSPNANKVIDLPIQEVLRRLNEIKNHYGAGTNVQISGGDPTLRNRKELMQIVRHARNLGLHPALFTNGILCSRSMLEELVENGLSDVAFHVDLTQGRNGYQTESELNMVREEYISRTHGLPLMVIFNTTIFEENFTQIPELVDFFVQNADQVDFASFQLQADTGRSILGKRQDVICTQSVKEKINEGAKNLLGWDAFQIGHPKCNSYAPTLVVNGKAFSMVNDPDLTGSFLESFKEATHDRRESPRRIAWRYIREMWNQPQWIIRSLKYFLPRLWKIRNDLLKSGGKVHKISFFIHNFMDASNLDPDRVNACSFMVMTPDGPMSMCAHNAKRDEFVLRSIPVQEENGSVVTFHPLKKTAQSTEKEPI